jgi:hypothetical protein
MEQHIQSFQTIMARAKTCLSQTGHASVRQGIPYISQSIYCNALIMVTDLWVHALARGGSFLLDDDSSISIQAAQQDGKVLLVLSRVHALRGPAKAITIVRLD